VAQRVLFVCSANSARSQMAEAFLRTLAGDAFEADSAGSQPEPVHPLAIAVMSEYGIDISDQRSKGLHEYMGKTQFDHLITVCDRAEKACPVFPGKGAREYWPMDDPLKAHIADFAQYDDDLTSFLEQIVKPISPKPTRHVGWFLSSTKERSAIAGGCGSFSPKIAWYFGSIPRAVTTCPKVTSPPTPA